MSEMGITGRVWTREQLLARQNERKHSAIENEVADIVSEVLCAADYGQKTITLFLPNGSGSFKYHSGTKSYYDPSSKDILDRITILFPDSKISVIDEEKVRIDDGVLEIHKQIQIDWS